MKYALVTGASRGIGRAISLRLSSQGYYILVNYRSDDTEAARTLELINQSGGEGEIIKFDVSDNAGLENALKSWSERNPGQYIEVLVNNAGIRKDILMMWMEDEHWKDVLSTNLDGFFYVTRALLKDMLVNKYGRIKIGRAHV